MPDAECLLWIFYNFLFVDINTQTGDIRYDHMPFANIDDPSKRIARKLL